jgi:hypothetical protein
MLRSSRWRALTDGRAFVLIVVVGGLLTLQSSNNLDPAKVVYLLLAGASLVGALASARWWLSKERAAIATPWLVCAVAYAVLLTCSLAVARAYGTPVSSWFRDTATYALFATAPIFGLACARSASRRWIMAALVVCGALASVSTTVEWLRLRQILDLPIDRIVLPAGSLAYALMALGTAVALAGGWHRWWWAGVAGVILGLFFVTGTRSTLILLVIPISAGLLAGRPWRRAARTLVIQAAVAVIIFLVADAGIYLANGTAQVPPGQQAVASGQPAAASGQPTPPPNKLNERLTNVGTLVTDPGADQSLQERWSQTKVAWQAFLRSPLVGVGPGYGFVWTNSSGMVVNAFTLDTPVVYLAKFGLVGLIPLLLFVTAYLRLLILLWRRRSQSATEFLAVAGFGILLAAETFLGAQMEDKGVSLALILLIGFGCRTLIQQKQEASSETPSARAAP